MTLFMDITALVLRRHLPVMTGIDRTEFAITRFLCDEWDNANGERHFVLNFGRLRGVVPVKNVRRLLSSMRTDRAICEATNDVFSRLVLLLASPPVAGNPAAGATRLSAPQRRQFSGRPDIHALGMALAGHTTLRRLLHESRGKARYLHTSHYGLHRPACTAWLSRYKVSATFFIHDLIPIDFPQFCSAGAHQSHKAKLERAARSGAVLAVNSRYTAGQLDAYLIEHGHPQLPITIHALGTDPLEPEIKPPDIPVRLHPYFICPGTIEGRKNIGLLLDVWRRVAAAAPTHQVPRLVLAGGRGWKARAVFDDLDSMRDIAPFVVEVNGLDDAAMRAIMLRAEAVLTPSAVEGFSLVPAEALAEGVPVIASDIEAHREFGARGITLVAKDDADQWAAAIRSPKTQREPAKMPRWNEFCRSVVTTALQTGAER